MAVADVHVLGADVLGALVPIVVGVVRLAGDETAEELREVLEKSRLELVHANAASGVWGVDARDPVGHGARADRVDHLVGDVTDAQAAGGANLGLALKDLHRRLFLTDRARKSRPNRQ